MITLRLTHLPAVVECETLDDAVELLRRVQEIPRTIEVLRARSGSLRVLAEASSGDTYAEEPREAHVGCTACDWTGPAEYHNGHCVATRPISGSSDEQCDGDPVPDRGDTLPAPAPHAEDNSAEQREADASSFSPSGPEQSACRARSPANPVTAKVVMVPIETLGARKPRNISPEARERLRQGARNRWAKVRAEKGEPAPLDPNSDAAKRARAKAENPDQLPEVRRTENGQPRGAGVAILTAFQRDEGFPLHRLARHVYGSTSPGCVARVRALIGREFVGTGKLAVSGPDRWRVTARGEEALRAATRPHEQTLDESLAIARATAGGRSAAE